MKCLTCGYALWNLRTRACPECNTPFAPTQFTFTPNAVAFACPHCEQRYFGTGAGGHLEPSSFRCARCGNTIDEDQTILTPRRGLAEHHLRPRPLPWLDNVRSPLLRWLMQVVWGLFMPWRVGDRLSHPVRLWPVAGFLLLSIACLALPGAVGVMVFAVAFAVPGGVAGFMPFIVLFAMPALLLLLAVPWALSTHVLLRVTGPTAHGFSTSLAAIVYTAGPCVLLAIPCLGPYAIPAVVLWWTVSAAAGIAAAQRVSAWRASLAAGLLPAILAAGLVALILLVVRPFILGVQANMQTTFQQFSTRHAETFAGALQARAAAGAPLPPSAALLILDDGLSPDAFFHMNVPRRDGSEMIGTYALEALPFMSDSEAAAARAAILNRVPEGPILAHRIADMVFTYHGVDIADPAQGDLWIAVFLPSPSVLPGQSAGPELAWLNNIALAQADGQTRVISPGEFQQALADQNARRLAVGLPALPDLHALAHGEYALDAPPPPPP